ncbi:MAG: phosphotransferase family protein [Bacteroidota bacterium]
MLDQAKEVRQGEALNWQVLSAYLQKELPELQGKMRVSQFHGGHANLTYLLTFGETELVLRRPPFGKIAPGAHDMRREYRVLSKLYRHFSPAPRAYHFCADESIIGAPFVVIERKRGVVVRYKLLDCFKSFENAEKRITEAMIRAQANLHLVDYEKANLSNLGKPAGFLERQLNGWSKRWNLSKTDASSDMDDILEWLQSDVPTTQRVSIIHNDIKPDNCQFQPNNPDKVMAIFDWDMCTLGDPLVDLATTLSYWPDDRFDLEKYPDLPVTLQGDFPPKSFLIERYQHFTNLDMSRLAWYEVFAYWKGTVIAQQLYKRYVDGQTKDERMRLFGTSAKAMIDVIWKIIGGLGCEVIRE